MPIERATRVGICVGDLGRSIRFYRDLLGFELLSDLDPDGQRIELVEAPGDPADPPRL